MRRSVKFGLLMILTLPLHLIVALAIVGVPRPPAVTVEGGERVGWQPVLDNAGHLWRARQSRSLVAWLPDGSGVLLRSRRWVLESRLHRMAAPGGTAEFLPRIPRNVGGVHGAPGRDHMILSWDTDGNEQHRLYRWDLKASEPTLLTTEDERAHFGAFEPDGGRIAYTSTRRNGIDFDVYVMDPEAPSSDRRVLELQGTWAVADWAPKSAELLMMRVRSNMESSLHVLDLVNGDLREVSPPSEGPVRVSAARWSPDGGSLFYASDRDHDFLRLRRLDLETGEEAVLTEEIEWDVESVQLSGDGETLLIGINEDGVGRYYTTDPRGSELRPLRLFGGEPFGASLHPVEPVLMVNHTDPLGVTRGYVHDLRTGETTLWAGDPPAARATSETRLVRYPTFDTVDGEARRISAFVYPGVGEGPRPVLIDIHGGPEAQARLRTGPNAMQGDGITVITPNVRGSTGYGRTFASLDDWYLREDAVRDIGSLLDWIGEQPDMDPTRVAVTGGSYGGYMVLASLVHFSPRLACGVDVVGVSNFVTFLENTADYRRDLRRAEYGDERIPEMRAFLESISPLNNAEAITSRLMVIQGANDPRVPVGESRQLVDRVRANGLDVTYMEGANEGHGFRHPWNAFYAGLAQQQLIRECLTGS